MELTIMTPLLFVALILIFLVSCAGIVAYIQGNQYYRDTEREAEESKKSGCCSHS